MLGRSNVLCNRYGVGDLESSMAVVVNYPNDTVCTCSDGTRTLRAIDDIGLCVFYIPTVGDWTVNIKEKVENGDSDGKIITVSDGSKQNVNMVMYLTRKYLKNTLTSYSGNATSIAAYAFYGRTALTEAESESVTSIGSYGFGACTNLEKVDLKSSSPVTIAANVFNGSTKLKDVIIRSDTVSTLSNVSAFTGTKIIREQGGVFVPGNLLSSYKSATNWSSIQGVIRPLDDYPTDDYSSISDTWEEIFAAEANGTYSSKYSVGDTKKVMYDGNGLYMKLIGIDVDDLSDDTGKAKLTWITIDVVESKRMHSSNNVAGSWPNMELKSYLTNTCFGRLPSLLQNNIKEVKKVVYNNLAGTTSTINEKIWIPSHYEMTNDGPSLYEESGPKYTAVFGNNTSDSKKIKYNSSGSAQNWWLRTPNGTTQFFTVSNAGAVTSVNANTTTVGLVLCFCT